MEQKAVVYKNIKGMSRDMSVSNGNNDFSYENYNIRITTRGKEDSLVVTNEKGTESNIIASRDVTKTVNTIFEGKKPDFLQGYEDVTSHYHDYKYSELYKTPNNTHSDIDTDYISVTEKEYATGKDSENHDITFFIPAKSKQNAILSSSNDDMVFGYNTEYPVANDNINNTLKIKGTFTLTEEPTKYLDEDIYLINDGTYTEDIELNIPAGKNNILKRISIKDIATGCDESDSTKWLESYKNLYNRLIERKFDFYGFTTNVHDFKTTSADSLQRIYQSINNGFEKIYSTGKYEQNEYYAESILTENNTTNSGVDTQSETDYFRVSTELPKLGFLNGCVLSDGFAYGTTLSLFTGVNAEVRLPIIRKVKDNETLADNTKIYVYGSDSKSNADIDYIGTYDEVKNNVSRYNNGIYVFAGYIKSEFDFDIKDDWYKNLGQKKKAVEISTWQDSVTPLSLTTPINKTNFEFSIEFSNPATLNFRVVGSASQTWKYEHNKWFLYATLSGERYVIQTLNVAGYYYEGITEVDSLDNVDVVTNFRAGILGKVKGITKSSSATYDFNDVYKFDEFDGTTQYTNTSTNSHQVKTIDGITFKVDSDNTTKYLCDEYSFRVNQTTNISISSITSRKSNNDYFVDFVLNNNVVLEYKHGTNEITIGNNTYYVYKLVSNEFEQPFIFYTNTDIYNVSFNNTSVLTFSDGVISNLQSLPYIIKKDLSGRVIPCLGDSFRIINDNGVLKFKSTDNDEFEGDYVITPLNELPIFNNGGEGNTKIKSDFRAVYVNPTFDVVVNNELFKFTQSKFNAAFETPEKAFKLKYSNDDWDNKYIYQKLDSVDDNKDYIKDGIYPYYSLDTTELKFNVEKTADDLVGKFSITKFNDNDIFFDGSASELWVTIKDEKDGSFSYRDTLSNFFEGLIPYTSIGVKTSSEFNSKTNIWYVYDDNTETYVVANSYTSNTEYFTSVKDDLYSAHEFYISDITSYETEPTGLQEDTIEQEVITVYQTEEIEKNFKSKIDYKILKDNNNKKYIRQIYKNNGFEKTSTIEYDFVTNYKNQFYSTLNFNVRVSNFGEYHSLIIPGRILGSCTIDEYVTLFFHYSSPALKFYKKVDDEYVYVEPNTQDVNELYTKRKDNSGEYDVAVKNGILLRDSNNDYINGKNKDYIVRLKYINAKPDNKENEWCTIVNKIANAATQIELSTPIVEKKPYYAAEILWSGDLGFNANNGIETIGYYESKEVIKVYWTDGKNQPRMINIMTPRELRNGINCVWDNKTFDFVQEINGSEKCKIKKQFGGGAFPAGSVQYYFTYSNQGGCETNPFISTPIYYTSQSSKGNSPLMITDNTFKITLYNLSKRFDYVNIYSVVRSTQNSQPYCKKVISLSMKNRNKTITFTDNNLLGETIDHTYLLMLQGTPINALTMAEKDNTLFLGNINKLVYNMTPDEKEKLKNCFIVTQKLRRYQNYNPNEEEWYENAVDETYRNDDTEKTISLEKNSSEIKTFMYNEYYRLGIQLQDKFGKWTDPIFIQDIKCDLPISNRIKYETSQEDGEKNVSNLQSFIPYFDLRIDTGMLDTFNEITNKYEYKRIRPVIVYPNISSRNVLCQGLLSPTMFNYSDRSVNGPFNFSSYFFRPLPPAISEQKDETGKYKFDIDVDVAKVGGYPIEYRHGYPITGYHDAVEEALAQGDTIGNNGVAQLVNNYLSKKPTQFVRLTSNTPGFLYMNDMYVRQGEVSLEKYDENTVNIIYKSGSKLYKVTHDTNKGHLNYIDTFGADATFSYSLSPDSIISNQSFKENVKNCFNIDYTCETDKSICFSSHMHYYKNKILQNLAKSFTAITAIASPVIITASNVAAMRLLGLNGSDHVVKKISDTECLLTKDALYFNEGGVTYKAYYPLTIKILPLSQVRKQKHRGLKRKTYYCDITVTASRIELSSTTNGAKYIDDGGFETDVAKKAYFAYNNGEIACANGNKNYNIFAGSNIKKVDDDYASSEVNVAGRKQSLFYIDESVCTLNSPEIEYNPTVQKIDLSNYKLNIIGAANITGYKNNINIDYETPPAILGSVVSQGFRHEPFEIQNFNTEAYRYMLSGAYWYDSYFKEGKEGEAEDYKNDSGLLSDQYCWWVYPFNRQILNNSRDGIYGKCRTKKWINYHYSAFSDYFGNSSTSYELDDAKQIYYEQQAVNLDTVWMKDKATYFGSCDTAYTNPVPLVGILGGSNAAEENAYEQSLAVSPHCEFKAGDNTYSSANLADIVPFTFASSNHFVLSLKGNDGVANVFPKYYTSENILPEAQKSISTIPFEQKYEFEHEGYVYYSSQDPVAFFGPAKDGTMIMKCENNTQLDLYLIKNMGVTDGNYYSIKYYDDEEFSYETVSWGTNVTIELSDTQSGLIEDEGVLVSVLFKKTVVFDESYSDTYQDFEYYNGYATLERNYNIPDSLIGADSQKPHSCIERYIQYNDVVENNNIKKTGIYDYGHVYIAQLERNVNGPDDVFSGTEESVLLQNTWFPAGTHITINEFKSNGLKYTEGDTYYQRYDCMKTYARSSSDINQNIEILSAMIQTRLNLDGIYSLRGSVDNVDANNTNTNLLNQAYTQDDNYFSYTITDPYISGITEYSNMFTWTLTKQIMSSKDNWTAINLISFYNATGSFGKITRLINYRNDIFCFQSDAISKILYNERVALTPSDGVPIEIGNSGKVQGLGYISSNVGCQNRWSVMPSKGFLYWVDDRRAEIYRFGEGLEPFSTAKGFSDWVKANTYGEDWKPIKSTNVPITTYYDNNNDDIYFVTEKDCLAYNEKIDAFESFFSYEDSFILNSAGNTIVVKEQDAVIKENTDIYDGASWWNNGIRGDGLSSIEIMHEGEYNRFFGMQMPFYVRFKVYPDNMQRDKIYTNLEFNMDAFDEKDIYLPDETFTRVRVWNEYQWGQWSLRSNNLYGTTAYKKRFRTHYLQLPRASYYPNGYYENFNRTFYREPMWLQIDNSVVNTNTGNVLNFLSGTTNDRIRNPWSWMELYKSNGDSINDFVKFPIIGTDKQKKEYYIANKNKLYLEQYVEVSQNDWSGYGELYKKVDNEYVIEANNGSDRLPSVIIVKLEIGYSEIDVTEETFSDLKKSLYIKVNGSYTQNGIDEFDENKTYYLKQESREDYDLSELYYKKSDGSYEKASQDMFDNPDIDLYKLTYNKLYSRNFISCANNFNFADDNAYFTLKNSNCRVEIYDVIVKYFEA
jgi:hypothetical protein